MRLFRGRLLDGFDQQIQIVLKKFEVVGGGFLRASNRWRQDQYFGSGLTSNRTRRIQIKIRLDETELHVHSLHVVDEIESVLGRWWNSGFRFVVTDDRQAEAIGEVRI